MKFVSAIRELPLSDFITCCAENDFSSIVFSGNPTKEQVDVAWMQLLSQYYAVRQDPRTLEQWQSITEMQLLRVRMATVNALCESLRMVYSPVIVFQLHKMGFDFPFTRETYLQELELVKNMEVQTRLDFESIQEHFAEQAKNSIDKDGNSVKQSEQIFYDYVDSYNECFKTSHSVDRMNTFEYANRCKRLDEHYKNLQTQNEPD
jgi:hypothetical protein